MLYKSGKCSVCGGSDVILTYSSEELEELFIEQDGSIIFSCPPYEDTDLLIEDIKNDSKNDEYDVYFTCYDCEDEADRAYITIDDEKYTNAKKAFLKIIKTK
jgi:hypothetical protein